MLLKQIKAMNQVFDNIARPLNLQAMGGIENTSLSALDQSIDLEKGIITDLFDRDMFTSPIKGETIITALKNIKGNIAKFKANAEKAMKEALKCCKNEGEPDETPSGWIARGIELSTDLPKMYSGESIRKNEETSTKQYDNSSCYRYNNAVEKYINILVDEVFATTLINKIEPSRTFYLSPRQMMSIGIGSK